MALEVPHQHVLGVLPERARELLSRDLLQLRRRPRTAGAQPGLDGPEAGQSLRLVERREPTAAEVDRVQLQAEAGARLVIAFDVGRGWRLLRERLGIRLDRVRVEVD